MYVQNGLTFELSPFSVFVYCLYTVLIQYGSLRCWRLRRRTCTKNLKVMEYVLYLGKIYSTVESLLQRVISDDSLIETTE
jgi:hypothetical protein